jgi:hypothetical protein
VASDHKEYQCGFRPQRVSIWLQTTKSINVALDHKEYQCGFRPQRVSMWLQTTRSINVASDHKEYQCGFRPQRVSMWLQTTKNNGPNMRKISPVTGLEWPRGFQEVKVPRFHDKGTGWW